MKYRLLLFVIMSFLLTGCATEGKFRDRLNTWLGANTDDLIMKWGPPTLQQELSDGSMVMEWHRSHGSAMINRPMGYSTVSFAAPYWCNIRFLANSSHIIQSYHYSGNSCQSD